MTRFRVFGGGWVQSTTFLSYFSFHDYLFFYWFICKLIYREWRHLQNILKFHMQYFSFYILLHPFFACTFFLPKVPNTFNMELKLLRGEIKLPAPADDIGVCYRWHMMGDIWNVTCDMWHVTGDMWHQQIAYSWEKSFVKKI